METHAVKYQLMWFSLGRWERGREAERKGGEGWIPLFLNYVFKKLVVEL